MPGVRLLAYRFRPAAGAQPETAPTARTEHPDTALPETQTAQHPGCEGQVSLKMSLGSNSGHTRSPRLRRGEAEVWVHREWGR